MSLVRSRISSIKEDTCIVQLPTTFTWSEVHVQPEETEQEFRALVGVDLFIKIFNM